ncbi:MAG: creatininase family protein [Balneolaceae bacterium]|nr:creatininase family protein [Balneolaceae bacterium]
MIWDQLTSAQIGDLNRNIPVVFVLAATEQHGSHLPLATDRMIGEYFGRKLHEMIPNQVLILPAIQVGCSDHHLDFPGTLSLTHYHFAGQAEDVVKSLLKHGFNKIIFLNSHGGNRGIGQVVVERLGHQFPEAHFVFSSWWQLAGEELFEISETGPGGVGHGGEFETSLMLLIAPELVVKEQISTKVNSPTFQWAEGDLLRASRAYYHRSMKKMTPSGVYGDPTKASAEKGKKIIDAVLAELKKVALDLYEASDS